MKTTHKSQTNLRKRDNEHIETVLFNAGSLREGENRHHITPIADGTTVARTGCGASNTVPSLGSSATACTTSVACARKPTQGRVVGWGQQRRGVI